MPLYICMQHTNLYSEMFFDINIFFELNIKQCETDKTFSAKTV